MSTALKATPRAINQCSRHFSASRRARSDQLDTGRSSVMLFAFMEAKLLTGIVQSGEPSSGNIKPLPHIPVTVYEATAQDPLQVGTATTDAEGRFELHLESDKNVWAVNNWKPNFDDDFDPTIGNPGGDGIVIFVGLAKPPRRTS